MECLQEGWRGLAGWKVSRLTLGAGRLVKPILRMNRVHIKTYGCQMNERDSEAVAAMCVPGATESWHEDDCDVLCCRAACAMRRSRAIGKAVISNSGKKSSRLRARILVAWRRTAGGAADKLPDVDLIVARRNSTRCRISLDNIRAARAGRRPIGASIVDIARKPGSQNTIRDHVAGAGCGEGKRAAGAA